MFGSWLGSMHFSEKKIIENRKSTGAGPCKVEKIVFFCRILTLIFPIFGEREKGTKYILKALENIESMEGTTLLCTLTSFHFA